MLIKGNLWQKIINHKKLTFGIFGLVSLALLTIGILASSPQTTKAAPVPAQYDGWFVMTVDTTKIRGGSAPDNQFRVEASQITPGYNYDVVCDTAIATSMTLTNQTGKAVCEYPTPGVYQVAIKPNIQNADGSWSGFPRIIGAMNTDSLKILSVDQWGKNRWQNMQYAFSSASNLTSVPGATASESPDLSSVTNMSNMFSGANAFNSDISSWDTSNVTNMSSMFYNARAFNSDLSSWDTSKVTNMTDMFYNARVFNSDLSSWDTSNVTNMSSMLNNARAFNQDLSSWDVSRVSNMAGAFNNSGLSRVNYEKTLLGWSQTIPQYVSGSLATSAGMVYCDVAGVDAMAAKGWALTGHKQFCPATSLGISSSEVAPGVTTVGTVSPTGVVGDSSRQWSISDDGGALNNNLFNINATTGALTFKSADSSKVGEYQVRVRYTVSPTTDINNVRAEYTDQIFTIKVTDTENPVITAPESAVFIEKKSIDPIRLTITDNVAVDWSSVTVTGLPSGLTFNQADKQIEGTPALTDWGKTEDERTFTVKINAKDTVGNSADEKSFTINVQRDTDGDGNPNVTDSDMDGDGISNEEEEKYGSDPRSSNSKPDKYIDDHKPAQVDSVLEIDYGLSGSDLDDKAAQTIKQDNLPFKFSCRMGDEARHLKAWRAASFCNCDLSRHFEI